MIVELMDELIDAFLFRSEEMSSVLNVKTGEILIDAPDHLTGEPGIDWDDEEATEDLVIIPQITTSEAYDLMFMFAKEQDPNVARKLFDALDGRKPFRRFKDKVIMFGIEEKWYEYEKQYAKERILKWLGSLGLSYS